MPVPFRECSHPAALSLDFPRRAISKLQAIRAINYGSRSAGIPASIPFPAQRPHKSPVFTRLPGASVETCGKEKFPCNRVLTFRGGMLILVSSLEATLLDREAEQTLFDN